jgi:proline iminopeptidase
MLQCRRRRSDVGQHGSGWSVARLISVALVSSAFASCSSGENAAEQSSEGKAGGAIAVEEARIDVGDGVVVQTRVVGPVGPADTLITIHGGPGLSLEAMSGFELLAGSERRVVSYDQRGTGRSTMKDDLDYSLDAHVADLEAIRNALGVGSVQLIGQSWGGAIASAYAATHPDRVSALVLVGAVPLDRAEYLAGQDRFWARVAELQQLGIIADEIPRIEHGSCADALRAVLPAYLDDPTSDTEVTVTSCTADTSRATYEAFVTDNTVSEYGDELAAFGSPALLLAGEHDVYGPDWLTRQQELLANAATDVVLIPDAGHLITAEQPDATLSAIIAFLADRARP